MSKDGLIQVGVITAAHGVRGQVKIRSLTDNPEDLFSCGALSDAAGNQLFRVEKHAGSAPNFIVTFKGISDRNAAELLKGTTLFARAGSLPEKEQMHHAIIGLEAKLPDGKAYGRVAGVYNFGAGDIVEFELTNGKTEMLPLNENFLDIMTDYIIVFPPDYVEPQ